MNEHGAKREWQKIAEALGDNLVAIRNHVASGAAAADVSADAQAVG